MTSSRKQIIVIVVVALVALALVVVTLRSFATGGDEDGHRPPVPSHERRAIKGRGRARPAGHD